MDKNYFTERIIELEADFRKAQQASSHHGEVGRSLEKSVMRLLQEYLPNKYSVDTGFVQTLEKPGWQSKQIDILLIRSDICYPLGLHYEFKVYPIESVIGFIEVTSNLTIAKLRKDYQKVIKLKQLSNRYYHIPKPPVGTSFIKVEAPLPRFYYFAFSTRLKQETITKVIIDLSNEFQVQLHALFVPSMGCFILPNAKSGAEKPFSEIIVENREPYSLISYLQHILVNLQTADFIPANASIPFGFYFDPSFRVPQFQRNEKKRINRHGKI